MDTMVIEGVVVTVVILGVVVTVNDQTGGKAVSGHGQWWCGG